MPSAGQGFNRWAIHPKWVRHFQRLAGGDLSKDPTVVDGTDVSEDAAPEDKDDGATQDLADGTTTTRDTEHNDGDMQEMKHDSQDDSTILAT